MNLISNIDIKDLLLNKKEVLECFNGFCKFMYF
jgi:hypothetical protein